MADYYPLIARAAAGLDQNTGENRRALYERARSALVAQLRGVKPGLEETEITRERLALEEAIRKVEREFSRTEKGWPISGDHLAQIGKLILQNDPFADRLPHDNMSYEDYLLRDPNFARPVARATQLIQEAQAEQRSAQASFRRAKLAEVASPAPSLSSDGRLDAGPNAEYDTPAVDGDLPALPIRQSALIKTILTDLPSNAPKYLKSALNSYDDELKARGAQPILGLLKDMAAIIEAAVGAPAAAREWLEDGVRVAFERFAENQALFVKHFPLDPKREEIYAETPVNESQATGPALSKPFEEVAKATADANKAGLTTDDFLKIVDKMAEFAKVVASLPPSQSSSNPATALRNAKDSSLPSMGPADRLAAEDAFVSPKKRTLLSGIGFFERVYNLLASTAQLTGPVEGNALLAALQGAIAALSKVIGF